MVPVVNEVIVSAPNKFEQADSSSNAISTDSITVKEDAGPVEVETTEVGKFLLSAKQKIRSLNMKNFFTGKPFQASVIPELARRGK